MQKLPTSCFIHGSVHAMVLMKLLVGQNRGADVENGQWTESEERRAGCIERPALTYILFFFLKDGINIQPPLKALLNSLKVRCVPK